jgi:hypothetical protein
LAKRELAARAAPDLRQKFPEVWEQEVKNIARQLTKRMMDFIAAEQQNLTAAVTQKITGSGPELTRLHTLQVLAHRGTLHDHADKIVAAFMAEAAGTVQAVAPAAETVPAG